MYAELHWVLFASTTSRKNLHRSKVSALVIFQWSNFNDEVLIIFSDKSMIIFNPCSFKCVIVLIIMPVCSRPPQGGLIMKWWALSVCLSVRPYSVCLSVCRVTRVPRPNSRTERPRKPKIRRTKAHNTRNYVTYLEVKRSKVKVTRPINALTVNEQYLPNGKSYEL